MLSLFVTPDLYRRFRSRPFLAVDWLTTGVVLSTVSVENGRPLIQKSQFVEFPAALRDSMTPDAAGAWLKSICSRSQFSTSAVVISIPRRELSMRLLELPNIPDDELGPLITLQMESRMQAGGQPLHWDCLYHPAQAADGQRYVMLATVPSSVIDLIMRSAQVAGWANPVLTSGDLLIPNLLRESDAVAETSAPWQLHIQCNRSKLELLLSHHGYPVAGYATAMPGGDDLRTEELSTAVNLILSTAGRMLAGCPSVWRSESERLEACVSGRWAREISAQLNSSGLLTSVLMADERKPRCLAIAASVALDSDKAKRPNGETDHLSSVCVNRLDFLSPRSISQKQGDRRRRGLRIAAIAAGLFGTAAAGLWMWHSSLQADLARLQTERQQLELFIQRGQAVVDKWSYVSRWQSTTLNAAVEIRNFAALLPARDRLILTRLQMENVVDSENNTLRIDGLAQDAEDVLEMNASILGQSEHYDLRPQGIEPAPVGSSFASQFRIEAALKNGVGSAQTPQEQR